MASFAIVTAGSDDDVLPMVALAGELKARGHAVRVATDKQYADSVAEGGAAFIELAGNAHQIGPKLHREIGRRSSSRLLTSYFDRGAPDWVGQAPSICDGAQCVIGSGLPLYAAATFAEYAGIPFVEAMLCPMNLLAPPEALKGALAGFWKAQSFSVNSVLRPGLGLAPYQGSGPHESLRAGGAPILCGFGPAVSPELEGASDLVGLTGFWLSHESPDKKASRNAPFPRLSTFLGKGGEIALVALGGPYSRPSEDLLLLVLQAVKLAGFRALVLLTSSLSQQARDRLDRDADVFVAADISFESVLPLASVVVHRGGGLVTAAALHAGVPSVTLPLFGEQVYWGGFIAKSGAGTPPLIPWRCSLETLVTVVKSVKSDAMKASVQEAAEKVRAENGLRTACEVLGRWLEIPKTAMS